MNVYVKVHINVHQNVVPFIYEHFHEHLDELLDNHLDEHLDEHLCNRLAKTRAFHSFYYFLVNISTLKRNHISTMFLSWDFQRTSYLYLSNCFVLVDLLKNS